MGRRARGGPAGPPPSELATRVGSVALRSPILTASGTAGHGDELGAYVDLGSIGAVVVKSESPEPWPGNAAPRVHQTPAGMINSVGLQGGGMRHWLDDDLPALLATGATVVASIWGRAVDDYERAATMLAEAPAGVVAVEANLSCPNTEHGNELFAHSITATQACVEGARAAGRPVWAKLSPNTGDVAEIAGAAAGAGAEAVTLVNTFFGMSLDVETARPRLGGGGGGVSGPAIHPLAVRIVYDVRAAHPDLPIVGVGGVSSGRDAVEFLQAGANAVEVGTATFQDPRAVARIQDEVAAWCRDRATTVAEQVGRAHR